MKTSIDKNLDSLVETFEKAGVKLTESQKAEIRKSVRELSPTEAARDAKFRAIFETIQHNMDVHGKLVAKKQEAEFAKKERRYQELIESMKTAFEENKRLTIEAERAAARKRLDEALAVEKTKSAEAVEKYLDEYLAKTIPEKQLVDYKRMQELETIVESLKDALALTNEDVEKRLSAIKQGYETKLAQAKHEAEETSKALTEATEKLNADKAKSYVARRVKDLPALEARMLQEKLAGCKSIKEARENFSRMLNEVEDELASGAAGGADTTTATTATTTAGAEKEDPQKETDDLDSKIDQLVDTSMGGGAEEGADAAGADEEEGADASGDAGAEGDLGSETSDGEEGPGGEAEAPAAGAPDFDGMSDDEINAHEFGSDEEVVDDDGEEAEQAAAPAAAASPAEAPAEKPAAPAAAAPAEEPVAEAVVSSAFMNRWIAECTL